MGCTQWDVTAEYCLECAVDDTGGWPLFLVREGLSGTAILDFYVVDNDELEIPYLCKEEIRNVIKNNLEMTQQIDSIEIIIPFRSKGYYDPGKLYGPPEKCYPAEWDDERTLFGNCEVIIYDWSQIAITKIMLSEKVSNELFDMFEEEIIKKDIGDVIADSQEDWRY